MPTARDSQYKIWLICTRARTVDTALARSHVFSHMNEQRVRDVYVSKSAYSYIPFVCYHSIGIFSSAGMHSPLILGPNFHKEVERTVLGNKNMDKSFQRRSKAIETIFTRMRVHHSLTSWQRHQMIDLRLNVSMRSSMRRPDTHAFIKRCRFSSSFFFLFSLQTK